MPKSSSFKRSWLLLPVTVLAVAWFWASRGKATPTHAEESTTRNAAVLRVERETLARTLNVQAEFRPYQEIDLHSKVAGFLENISVDIGDRVKEGQSIAHIEVPELQDDLTRADAVAKRSVQEVARAEAAFEEAKVAYGRLTATAKAQPNLIAQQDLDASRAKELVAESTLAAAKEQVAVANAEVKRLHTTLRYASITVPFSGIVTRRNVDPGQLIQAGMASSTQAIPLVRISQIDRLRLVFPVSMSYVPLVRAGDEVEVRVSSLGRKFKARITRFTHKIDSNTRTMDVEVDVENADLSLVPGMYASVEFTLEQKAGALALPVQAVTRGEAPSVLIVNSRSEVEERKVKLGLETPAKVEVVEGLAEGDMVLIGSRSQFKPGQKVTTKVLARKEAE